MAYEYQSKNGSCIEVVNMIAGSKDLSKPMVDELDEVYRKAEILNKIVDIIKTGRSLNSNIDFEIIVLAIEQELRYLEDKND